MALTYNIEEDVRYKQGQESVKETWKEQTKKSILEMLKDGLAYQTIAKYAEVSKEFVERIAKELKK